MAFDKLSYFAAGICVLVLHGAVGLIEANAVERPSIDLGDISSRPVAQRVPFERFFQIHNVSGLEFSPDARTLYFLRNDGHVDNVFAIDLVDRRMRQVTAFREPVHRLLVGRRGKYLIIAQSAIGQKQT